MDGRDESKGNWMRFVNCSRSEDEQNLVSFQFRGKIYYRTYKPISPGKELLVWYGESYARDLGLSTDNSHCNVDPENVNGKQNTILSLKSKTLADVNSLHCTHRVPSYELPIANGKGR